MLKLANRKKLIVENISKFNNETVQNVKAITAKFEERVKGTIAENWLKYWRNVFIDYRDVVVDVGKDMKEKPIKAVCIWSLLASLVYCAKHNPNEASFRDAYVNNANRLLLVHPTEQRHETRDHLKYIESCYNNRTIRRLNIGIASIMWTDYYSDACQNYQSNCPHLQLQYKKFGDRILDVGFLNRWLILNSKMIDYDVNY